MKIVGATNKVITVNENLIEIVKTGLLSSERKKLIPISTVTGVEVRKPGMLFRGFIQIQTAGQNSPSSSFKISGGTYSAVTDENSVVFDGKDNYTIALEMQKYILSYSKKDVSSASPADEIAKFKKLLDDGTISEEEFILKKKQLLGV